MILRTSPTKYNLISRYGTLPGRALEVYVNENVILLKILINLLKNSQCNTTHW